MPDIATYVAKHMQYARRRGVGWAARSAVQEAAVWAGSRVYGGIKGRGRLIWADDWDICLVVDACRHDAFQDVARGVEWLPDDPGHAWSVGSASPEWYGQTFAPDALPAGERIGVVTANPFSAKPAERAAGAPPGSLPLEKRGLELVDEVWRDHWGCTVEDGYLDVTPPSAVTDRAYSAWANNDLDRLVVHYMQPHIPFRSRPEWFGIRENLKHFGEPRKEGNEGRDPWKRVRDGELPAGEFWYAYLDNLRWVLEDVDRLRQAIDGQLLVTSDHGNGRGECGVWSHPPGVHLASVRRVPWVPLEGMGTGTYEYAATTETATPDVTVQDRLRALGYHE